MGFEQHVSKAPAATTFTDAMEATLQETKTNILLSQERIKLQSDKHHCEAPQYEVGDNVWLRTDNLRLTCTLHKLMERWLDPYEVMELVSMNAVCLCLPCSVHIHNVVNISCIKPYKERLLGQSVVASGPVEVTED